MSEKPSKYDEIIEDDKNKISVHCQYCNSKILAPKMATYTTLQRNLPFMTQKKDGVGDESEELTDFWSVKDMFTFENIGFTHTVDDIKYLSCADCEMGPVGFHIISSKENFVALDRVKHTEN